MTTPEDCRKGSKTVDIGLNGVSVSTDRQGTILQISTFHPKHGIVLAEPYEQFDGSRFRDTPYVREYRARMLKSIQSGTPGFGLRFNEDVQSVEFSQTGLGHVDMVQHTATGVRIATSVIVNGDGQVTQSSQLSTTDGATVEIAYAFDLGISINRASYGQLTEGGPIPMPESENKIETIDGGDAFAITNTLLGAHLVGCLKVDGEAVALGPKVVEQVFTQSPVKCAITGSICIVPRSKVRLDAAFWLQPGTIHASPSQLRDDLSPGRVPALWPTPETPGRFIVRRNLEYILGNCAIPLSPSNNGVCILTDHVALPLGWMRDNYWQIRFLMDIYQNLDNVNGVQEAGFYSQTIADTAKGHLNWIFRFAQRPHGFWHRSYLTTGRPKDGPVFQLDQQCYPLLELCDFWDTFPDQRTFVEEILRDHTVSQVLDLIESKKVEPSGLFSTDETPGDDAVEYPFHFSSHILLWHTASRLAKMAAEVPGGSQLSTRSRHIANGVRAATMKHFLSPAQDQGQSMFSYLVDGVAGRTVYHDANDIPTLFANAWGFLITSAAKEAWHNTMRFGFSLANDDGYYPDGPFGGLGSVHTRGPWTLGYFQSWRYAQMVGDLEAESDAWRKILGTMQWDGTFSEAVDANTGDCTSKAWFSWPGSMIGAGLLQDGNREKYL